MIISLTAYMQKDDHLVKKLMMASAFFWGTHFFLLWVFAWFIAILIWYVRMILSMKYEKNKKALIFIVCISLVSAYFTYDGLYSLIPVLGSIVGAYAFFYLKAIRLRLAMLFNSLIWLVYHIHIGSSSGILNEILVQSVLIMTIYRMAHPEWWMQYYSRKIWEILLQRKKVDYDRYIIIRDRVFHYRKKIWTICLKILRYDLCKYLPKMNIMRWKIRASK